MTANIIDEFKGESRFLSNFYPCWIQYGRRWYPTAEHAYQAAKATNTFDHDYIANAREPSAAKRRGNSIAVRADWESVKLGVMRDVLRAKFGGPVMGAAPGAENPLRQRLLNTGHAHLMEGNHWNDVYWGVCAGMGENHLGRLLMEVREELRHAS